MRRRRARALRAYFASPSDFSALPLSSSSVFMWSSAQITNYEPAALLGSLVVCICNLGAKNIAGFTSELLILGAKDADGKVIVLGPRSEVATGEAIF